MRAHDERRATHDTQTHPSSGHLFMEKRRLWLTSFLWLTSCVAFYGAGLIRDYWTRPAQFLVFGGILFLSMALYVIAPLFHHAAVVRNVIFGVLAFWRFRQGAAVAAVVIIDLLTTYVFFPAMAPATSWVNGLLTSVSTRLRAIARQLDMPQHPPQQPGVARRPPVPYRPRGASRR